MFLTEDGKRWRFSRIYRVALCIAAASLLLAPVGLAGDHWPKDGVAVDIGQPGGGCASSWPGPLDDSGHTGTKNHVSGDCNTNVARDC